LILTKETIKLDKKAVYAVFRVCNEFPQRNGIIKTLGRQRFCKGFLGIDIGIFILDLFNNRGNDILSKWAGERRHRMPRMLFSSGCTG
jgi:hypothetical protein